MPESKETRIGMASHAVKIKITPAQEAVKLSQHVLCEDAFTAFEVVKEYCRVHCDLNDEALMLGIATAVYTYGRIAGIRSERAKKAKRNDGKNAAV